jgi:putative ABC transport system permease protein
LELDSNSKSAVDISAPIIMLCAKGLMKAGRHKLNDAAYIGQDLAKAEKTFKQYDSEYPFEFHFIDREYAQKFSDEQVTGTLATLFAGLTFYFLSRFVWTGHLYGRKLN